MFQYQSLHDIEQLELFEVGFPIQNAAAIQNLAGLWSGSLRRNSSTWRFFPRRITTRFENLLLVWKESEFQFRWCQDIV